MGSGGLLVTWGASGPLRKDFINIEELGLLREICANIEGTFLNAWERDNITDYFAN